MNKSKKMEMHNKNYKIEKDKIKKKKIEERIESKKKKLNALLWLGRILILLFILFVTIFILQSVSLNENIGTIIHTTLILLIPSAILCGLLLLSWKYQLTGGFIFISIGIYFIIKAITQPIYYSFSTKLYFIFAIPMIVISILLFTYGAITFKDRHDKK